MWEERLGAGSRAGETFGELLLPRFGVHSSRCQVPGCQTSMCDSVINIDYRFTGRKEAGINENSSYYILTQCEDGAFEAVPIHNWYNFTADIKYQTLTADEAEEEFGRREKTVNYFSLMVKKRLMDNKEDLEEGDEKNMLDKTIKAASRTGNLVRNKGWGRTIYLLFNSIKILIMAFPISTFQFNNANLS